MEHCWIHEILSKIGRKHDEVYFSSKTCLWEDVALFFKKFKNRAFTEKKRHNTGTMSYLHDKSYSLDKSSAYQLYFMTLTTIFLLFSFLLFPILPIQTFTRSEVIRSGSKFNKLS